MGHVYDNHRKNFPLRLHGHERDAARGAAARMPPGKALGASSWTHRAWTEADWFRTVGLDWAAHVSSQPATNLPQGELPSEAVARLTARVAELEAAMKKAGVALPSNSAPSAPKGKRKGRAA